MRCGAAMRLPLLFLERARRMSQHYRRDKLGRSK
jgi:hypothetical protein